MKWVIVVTFLALVVVFLVVLQENSKSVCILPAPMILASVLRKRIEGLSGGEGDLAGFWGNSSRLDFHEAPQSLRLACGIAFRLTSFIFGLPASSLRTLIAGLTSFFLIKTIEPSLRRKVLRLKAEYHFCAQTPRNYTIYA